MVRRVRPRLPETPPAHVAARPVAAARVLAARELCVLDRRCGLPVALVVAVVGYARRGTDARAGQDRNGAASIDKPAE